MCWGSSCSLKLNLNKLCNSQKFSLEFLFLFLLFFVSFSETLKNFFPDAIVVVVVSFLCLIRCHNLKIYLFSPLFCVFIFTFHVFSAEKNQWDYIFCAVLSCLCRNNGSMLLFFSFCCCRCCCVAAVFLMVLFYEWGKKRHKIFGLSLVCTVEITWSAFIVAVLLKHQS